MLFGKKGVENVFLGRRWLELNSKASVTMLLREGASAVVSIHFAHNHRLYINILANTKRTFAFHRTGLKRNSVFKMGFEPTGSLPHGGSGMVIEVETASLSQNTYL